MSAFLRTFLKPILKPLSRFIVGLIAIPLFRLFMRRVVRLQQLDAELEKDLEQWFRASLVLLVATANMEVALFGWLNIRDGKNAENRAAVVQEEGGDLDEEQKADEAELDTRTPMGVFLMGLRLLLAMSVVEMMPDQELFSIIHPGPPKFKRDRSKSLWKQCREMCWPMTKGVVCQHLNRSSPVFAILSAIAEGWVGWFCYFMALAQYLIIGLVTSKDKALDALSEFDRQVAERRRELIEEFEYIEHEVEEKNKRLAEEMEEHEDAAKDNPPQECKMDDKESSA